MVFLILRDCAAIVSKDEEGTYFLSSKKSAAAIAAEKAVGNPEYMARFRRLKAERQSEVNALAGGE